MQRAHGGLIASWSASQTEIDPTRVQDFQRAELLGDDQWRMVREHNAARAEPDGGSIGGDMRDQHCRGRRRDRIDAVVLGIPDAMVARGFRQLGYLHTTGETLRDGFAFTNRGEIENRQGNTGSDRRNTSLVSGATRGDAGHRTRANACLSGYALRVSENSAGRRAILRTETGDGNEGETSPEMRGCQPPRSPGPNSDRAMPRAAHVSTKRMGSTMSVAYKNWAGVYTFAAAAPSHPETIDEVRRLVASARKVHGVGSRHCFNGIADSAEMIAFDRMPMDVEIDREAGTATVNAGMCYARELGRALEREGLSLPNTASLPHITAAGGTATATHGSGDKRQNLAGAVSGLECVTAEGDLLRVERGDPDFAGMVVHIGALGVVTA